MNKSFCSGVKDKGYGGGGGGDCKFKPLIVVLTFAYIFIAFIVVHLSGWVLGSENWQRPLNASNLESLRKFGVIGDCSFVCFGVFACFQGCRGREDDERIGGAL